MSLELRKPEAQHCEFLYPGKRRSFLFRLWFCFWKELICSLFSMVPATTVQNYLLRFFYLVHYLDGLIWSGFGNMCPSWWYTTFASPSILMQAWEPGSCLKAQWVKGRLMVSLAIHFQKFVSFWSICLKFRAPSQ